MSGRRGPDSGYGSRESPRSDPTSEPAVQNAEVRQAQDVSTAIVASGSMPTAQTKVKIQEYVNVEVPAQVNDRWEDLQRGIFTRSLHEYVTRRRFSPSRTVNRNDYVVKLAMYGETEATAVPFIVVRCQPFLAKRFGRYFSQPHLLDYYRPSDPDLPKFNLLINGKSPFPIAKEVTYFDNSAEFLCGMLIVPDIKNTRYRGATIGGLVEVVTGDVSIEDPELHGLTVRHFFENDPSPAGGQQSETDWDEESAVDVVSELDRCAIAKESFFYKDDDVLGPQPSSSSQEVPSPTTAFRLLAENPRSLTETSAKIPGRDLGDSLSHLDWALVVLPREKQLHLRSTFSLQALTISVHHNSRPRLCTVELTAGVTGQVKGKLRLRSSFIMMNAIGVLVTTHTLTLDDGLRLQKGDCGTWVKDAQTNTIYGHVVAADDFGDAYVIPIEDTIEDIRKTLNATCINIYQDLPASLDQAHGERAVAHAPLSSRRALSPPNLPSHQNQGNYHQHHHHHHEYPILVQELTPESSTYAPDSGHSGSQEAGKIRKGKGKKLETQRRKVLEEWLEMQQLGQIGNPTRRARVSWELFGVLNEVEEGAKERERWLEMDRRLEMERQMIELKRRGPSNVYSQLLNWKIPIWSLLMTVPDLTGVGSMFLPTVVRGLSMAGELAGSTMIGKRAVSEEASSTPTDLDLISRENLKRQNKSQSPPPT